MHSLSATKWGHMQCVFDRRKDRSTVSRFWNNPFPLSRSESSGDPPATDAQATESLFAGELRRFPGSRRGLAFTKLFFCYVGATCYNSCVVMNSHVQAEKIGNIAHNPALVSISVGNEQVSGLFQNAVGAEACYIFAHGAGAGMTHAFMTTVAEGLAKRSIGTLRFQFPYMEKGSRRPDPPPIAQATVRAAVIKAARLAPGLPLFAGGKSFGGRMTSQAQAESALPGVRGLVFLGFPLHPSGQPSNQRANHLGRVKIPMLFLQGANDPLAELNLLKATIKSLGPLATLRDFADADHSFHVPKRSGRSDSEILVEMLDQAATWMLNTAKI